jgi:pyruvate dehydrogenase E1 component alpha subunit
MRTIREFEDAVHEEFSAGNIPGLRAPLCRRGGVGVGVCMHLDDRDTIASTHRGHGHCIAKGCDVDGMMKEIFGRKDGFAAARAAPCTSPTLSKGCSGRTASSGRARR